jgi:hypothetical protein
MVKERNNECEDLAAGPARTRTHRKKRVERWNRMSMTLEDNDKA